MRSKKTAYAARIRRHRRVRKKVQGTQQRPRLSVYRSLSHIYVQLIDDDSGRTLAAASDIEQEGKGKLNGSKKKTDVAKAVGGLIAERAKGIGIERVVFDRAGYRYHGRVAALATGAREGGLQF